MLSSHKKRPRPKNATNQDALEYVQRMREVHKIDSQTIATFVSILKVRLIISTFALLCYCHRPGLQDKGAVSG